MYNIAGFCAGCCLNEYVVLVFGDSFAYYFGNFYAVVHLGRVAHHCCAANAYYAVCLGVDSLLRHYETLASQPRHGCFYHYVVVEVYGVYEIGVYVCHYGRYSELHRHVVQHGFEIFGLGQVVQREEYGVVYVPEQVYVAEP